MVVANAVARPSDYASPPRPTPEPTTSEREKALHRARDMFLRTRRVAPGVRPAIAASWRRSILCGVSPTAARPQYAVGANLDCQLVRVARPLLEEREDALADTNCALVLTDAEANILGRWVVNENLSRALAEIDVLAGYCVSESVIGTNSAALALETGKAAKVHGAEHLCADLLEYSSAAAPIVHPVRRRLLGALSLTCRTEDASPLQIAWLHEVIREISRRLRVEIGVHEQLLLEAYLSATRDCRHPVVCLNDQTILSNSAAARLLGTDDQALLWEQASRVIHERTNEVSTFLLSDGQRVSANCSPIFDGVSPVGAMVEIQLDQATRRKPRVAHVNVAASLGSLAGRGELWQRLCSDLAEATSSGGRILLLGESGSGKLVIAQALFDGELVDVFDCALHAVEHPSNWVERLNARLRDPHGVVLLQHLESLDMFTARTVASLIKRASTIGPRIVGTLNSNDGAPAQTSDMQMECFDAIVRVPALRDRLEDLRDLLQVLTSRHAGLAGAWHWMPDAIQTLSRVPWPSNVRSLEAIIKQVVTGRTPGYVDARSLPAQVRAAGSRRQLSRLEQLEATAITEALRDSQGNKLEAAQRLGIARSTLYRRLRALGIDLTEANY
jgi:transcriptional regulator of acetoin/glycerol metabolism